MAQQKKKASEIQRELRSIAGQGIQADRKKLKKDMCEQFADPREWIREFVVNACDADATVCWISGWEDAETITITVEDNGHGMDRKGVLDFNMLYRSVKKSDINPAVGQFGVGKLSVAAMPGQCRFSMTTSTGKEAWRMKAKCLLDDDSILLEQIDPVPPTGTKFEITFKKEHSLNKELLKLEQILENYLRYKDITICVSSSDGQFTHWLQPRSWGGMGMDSYLTPYSRRYILDLDGTSFDVVLSIGATSHELYKQRVLITKRYNLLFPKKRTAEIPYLTIRVDSNDFQVPIGRHCLSNEELLAGLSQKLGSDLLPQYVNELLRSYQKGFPDKYGKLYAQIEEMACALMLSWGDAGKVWNRFPLFILKNDNRLSLFELQEKMAEKGKLYMEGEESVGADYSIFDAPVLAKKQPRGGKEVLEKMFADFIINLGIHDIIFERPRNISDSLSPLEEKFQKYLGFHPSIVKMNFLEKQDPGKERGMFGIGNDMSQDELERLSGVFKESREAIKKLEKIKWRINYLVHQDGRTPCSTQLFLFNNDTVVLNLNHAEIRKFVDLTELSPALAGHWALAMCLTSDEKILPDLTPQVREDLVLMDAIAKCGTKKIPELLANGADDEMVDRAIQDFFRNSRGDASWLN